MRKSAKRVLLLHNPTAGDEGHGKEAVTNLVSNAGYQCSYRSVKDRGWKKGLTKSDLVVVAGGDGTVRKTALALLEKSSDKLPPVAVLPMGTANNISKTINASSDEKTIVESWRAAKEKPFDVGRVEGLSQKHFFIEALGFGVFPTLVNTMKVVADALVDEPEQNIETAQILLAGIIRSYKAKPARIEIDGADYSGDYLLVEVMNIASFGPNLALTQSSDPCDGQFDVVLIQENNRQQLIDYVRSKIRGDEKLQSFPTIRGSRIRLKTAEKEIHVDDEIVKNNEARIDIKLLKGRLRFLG